MDFLKIYMNRFILININRKPILRTFTPQECCVFYGEVGQTVAKKVRMMYRVTGTSAHITLVNMIVNNNLFQGKKITFPAIEHR